MPTTSSGPVKPLVSRGYTKIVGLTLLAIVIGCGLIAWEFTVDYDWTLAAKKATAPKIGSLPPAEKGAPAPAPGPGPAGPGQGGP